VGDIPARLFFDLVDHRNGICAITDPQDGEQHELLEFPKRSF
jgi:hypothetical protein